jgi:hypothetical protein
MAAVRSSTAAATAIALALRAAAMDQILKPDYALSSAMVGMAQKGNIRLFLRV